MLSEINQRQTLYHLTYMGNLEKKAKMETRSPAHTRRERALGAARGRRQGVAEMGGRVKSERSEEVTGHTRIESSSEATL